MEEDNFESKFVALLNKLQEVSVMLNEAVVNIKEGLIPSFEKSMAEMQLSLDKLVDRNSFFIKKFENQTNLLSAHIRNSIKGIKAIFDINKIEQILKTAEELSNKVKSSVSDFEFKELSEILKKISKNISGGF